MANYTKKTMIDNVSKATGLTKGVVAEVIEAVFEEVKSSVATGETVAVHQFGKFERVVKAERNARNPKTGEAVVVPEHYAVKFKPSADFKSQVAE